MKITELLIENVASLNILGFIDHEFSSGHNCAHFLMYFTFLLIQHSMQFFQITSERLLHIP
jgi:hypothetical protein